jgi:uncharacterized cupin superfamily protein
MSTDTAKLSGNMPSRVAQRVLVAAEDTGSRFTIVTLTLPPFHPGAPVHAHPANAEGCYILEGTLGITQGERTMMLKPGAAAHTPAGVAHSIWNPTAGPTTVLLIYTPALEAATAEALEAGTPESPPPFLDTS